MRLKNQVALITGGASGIGRATALLFAREGAAVAVADLDQAGAQAVARQIEAEGGQAIALRCDVSQAADCQRAVQQTVDAFGSLDILFNNAGIIRRANVVDTTEEEWDRVMAVNVKSVFLMSRYAIPYMAGRGGGVIINTASGWGLVGGRQAAAYCASKAAVVNLTRAMALRTSASTASAPATPPPGCCATKPGSSARRRPTFWPRPPTGPWVASAPRRRSPRRCSTWPATPPRSSPGRRWSWMGEDWRGRIF